MSTKEENIASGNPRVPRHIAIIMDGNGRWAQARGREREYGHQEGVKSVRKVLTHCGKCGVEVLTLYTFSEENWNRPEEEVSALMGLLVSSLEEESDELMKNNVRLTAIGNLDKLPELAREVLDETIKLTKNNDGIHLQLALSYSSKQELVQAVRKIIEEGAKVDEVTEEFIAEHLYTGGVLDPDLIIRTGGEQRLSNFLLWQGAYSELYFCDDAWPDFDEAALDRALDDYRNRERRYGKTSAQIMTNNNE